METYNNLEFSLYYLDVNNIKQKHYGTISNLIGMSRLRKYMILNSPGHLYFEEDDYKHHYPKIEKLAQYNRNKVNCMIYDLPYNAKNDEFYDKMFIYYSDFGKNTYYGYLAYNTNTGKCLHRYLIGGDYNELTRVLNEFFESLFDSDKYVYYNKKYDACKKRNGLTLDDCPTIVDYKKMIVRKDERIEKYKTNT